KIHQTIWLKPIKKRNKKLTQNFQHHINLKIHPNKQKNKKKRKAPQQKTRVRPPHPGRHFNQPANKLDKNTPNQTKTPRA
ncbi:hypothetical protein ACX13T_22595, partial [Salmonella enterica]